VALTDRDNAWNRAVVERLRAGDQRVPEDFSPYEILKTMWERLFPARKLVLNETNFTVEATHRAAGVAFNLNQIVAAPAR
jgi:hypothetical protein